MIRANLLIGIFLTAMASCSDEKKEETSENSPKQAEEKEAIAEEQTNEIKSVSEPVEIEEEVFDYSKIEHYAVFDTKSRLVENFGKENIEDGSTWYGEGTLELQHSVLTNPNNGAVIKYVWSEEDAEKLSLIEVRFYRYDEEQNVIGNQVLGTDCGVRTGMSINDLHKWNGEEVKFSGFGWDFGGQVINAEGTKFEACNATLQLGLKNGVGEETFNQFSGDTEFSSANSDVLSAGIVVTDITYFVEE